MSEAAKLATVVAALREWSCELEEASDERAEKVARAVIAAYEQAQAEPYGWVLPTGHGYGFHKGPTPPVEGVGWKAVHLAAPVAEAKPLPLKELERLIYEHTKINPNVADDRELLGYIVNAARAIEQAHGIGAITGSGNAG